MTTAEKWILGIIIIIVIFLFIFWNKIATWFGRPSSRSHSDTYNDCLTANKSLPEGAPCTMCFDPAKNISGHPLGALVSGVIHNGICIGQNNAQNNNSQQNNNPPSASNNLQVSNPNGAVMYYKSPLKYGGFLYSPSNIALPLGTKMILINTLVNPSIGGKYFYETDYKQYGPNSGFFNTDDLIKI